MILPITTKLAPAVLESLLGDIADTGFDKLEATMEVQHLPDLVMSTDATLGVFMLEKTTWFCQ